MIKKILLKKSAVENKMPSPEQLDYGEIALNFNTMNPFISFKDTADGIRQIKDYSNEILNINGYLTDAKNEINYLRPLVTDNNTNLMFLRSDFEDFKTDNTNEINALRTDIDKNTDAIATINTSIEQKADKTELDTINANVDKKVSKTDIVQNTGQSTTSVMSQKAVSDAFSTKVNKTDITQSTGTSTTSVMSQKAVSDIVYELERKSVTNAADEEDITVIEENGKQKLKFADRNYEPLTFSGKGYKILRKNIVEGKNILTQDMINESNTVYEIRYDFDLNGAEITVPENCVLKFNGGNLSNGN